MARPNVGGHLRRQLRQKGSFTGAYRYDEADTDTPRHSVADFYRHHGQAVPGDWKYPKHALSCVFGALGDKYGVIG